MRLHDDPKQAEWDRRIIEEASQQYVYGDIFDWRAMRRVVDVGAHIGAFACWLHGINPAAEIVTVEPDRTNYELSLHNLPAAYGITPYCGVVWYGDEPLVMQAFREPDNAGSHTVRAAQDGDPVFETLRYTLEELVDDHEWPAIDALKLDCEGSEYNILANAPLDILRGCQVIVGEYHDGPDRFRAECVDRLASWFDVVFLGTTRPLGFFCLISKAVPSCG